MSKHLWEWYYIKNYIFLLPNRKLTFWTKITNIVRNWSEIYMLSEKKVVLFLDSNYKKSITEGTNQFLLKTKFKVLFFDQKWQKSTVYSFASTKFYGRFHHVWQFVSQKYKARYFFLWYVFRFIMNGKLQKIENAYFDQSSSEIWKVRFQY